MYPQKALRPKKLARSHPPIRCAMASLSRHTILLACKDSAEFQRLSDEYEQLYLPASVVEVELVKSMIAARWRIGRRRIIEATLLDNEIANPGGEFEEAADVDAPALPGDKKEEKSTNPVFSPAGAKQPVVNT